MQCRELRLGFSQQGTCKLSRHCLDSSGSQQMHPYCLARPCLDSMAVGTWWSQGTGARQACSGPDSPSCCSAMANWGLACVDQAPSQPRSASGSRRKRRDQEAAVPHNSSHRPQDSWLMVMDSSAMSCPAMALCWRTSTVTPWHSAWSSAARNSQAQPSPPTMATKGLAGSTARRQPSPSRRRGKRLGQQFRGELLVGEFNDGPLHGFDVALFQQALEVVKVALLGTKGNPHRGEVAVVGVGDQ